MANLQMIKVYAKLCLAIQFWKIEREHLRKTSMHLYLRWKKNYFNVSNLFWKNLIWSSSYVSFLFAEIFVKQKLEKYYQNNITNQGIEQKLHKMYCLIMAYSNSYQNEASLIDFHRYVIFTTTPMLVSSC